jgi:hypothetical protein
MRTTVNPAPKHFSDWDGLLRVLHAAFASQAGRIDPTSSLHQLNAALIADKAAQEHLFLAHAGDAPSHHHHT